MSKTTVTFLFAGLGLLIIFVGYLLFPAPKQEAPPAPLGEQEMEIINDESQGTQGVTSVQPASPQPPAPASPQPSAQPATHTVNYTGTGYSPSELRIKAGDTVTFVNRSSSGMWTASALHPSHATYGGTALQEHCPDASNNSFDECESAQPGESWSFTFTKKGTWGYHNHVQAFHFGKIIVE